jgi:hypothetical protein
MNRVLLVVFLGSVLAACQLPGRESPSPTPIVHRDPPIDRTAEATRLAAIDAAVETIVAGLVTNTPVTAATRSDPPSLAPRRVYTPTQYPTTRPPTATPTPRNDSYVCHRGYCRGNGETLACWESGSYILCE